MRFGFLLALLVLLGSANAYTGICFLDTILNALDSISSKIVDTINPTTTTTTSTSSTSSTSTTTTTSQPTYTTTSTTQTTTSSTTTLFSGECMSWEDCPQDSTTYICNFEGNVESITRVFFCANPGPDSECKSRESRREIDICQSYEVCVEGVSQCIEE